MKAVICKSCTVACLPGSVVEVTETQFRLLGDAAVQMESEMESKSEIVLDDTEKSEAKGASRKRAKVKE